MHRLSRVVVTPCPVPVLAGGMGYQPTGPGERRPVSRRCAVTAHGPVQPVWSCGGCGLPWPCPTRKQELRAQFAGAPVSLALYLGSYLVQAAEDMPRTPAGALHHRFIGWTRRILEVQQRSTATMPAGPNRDAPQQANPARKPQPKRVRSPTRSPCRLPDANQHGSENPGNVISPFPLRHRPNRSLPRRHRLRFRRSQRNAGREHPGPARRHHDQGAANCDVSNAWRPERQPPSPPRSVADDAGA